MRRSLIPLLGLSLALPALASAGPLPAPARLGDLSVGLGPALVANDDGLGGGATAEANLLLGIWSLGAHVRAADVDGAFHPAVGVEVAFAGALGLGTSYQARGLSIDGLLAVPIPLFRGPWYVTLGWRPSFLLGGGTIQEVALQVKWTSLLVPVDE